jgi:hypothetical protein
MTQLITNYFRLHNVKQFRESINETANSTYYVFTGRHTPYVGGVVPIIPNSVDNTLYTPYDEMVFGKRVTINDVMTVVPRHNWTSGEVYTPYRSSSNLVSQPFYVCVNATSEYHVFKCLDNNGGANSTAQPTRSQTDPDDEYYSTQDGYVWKYMYSFDSTTFNKFATQDYIPVAVNANVAGNAVSGAIDVVTVSYRGSHYNTYLTGTFTSPDLRVGGNPLYYNIADTASSSSNFYNGSYLYITSGTGQGQGRRIVNYTVLGGSKTVEIDSAFTTNPDTTSVYEITPYVIITGDGSNAIARAIVNTSAANTISQIEIISRGSGYTYASAIVTGNTGGVQNAAILSVVMGPKGGHGSDPEYELGASSLMLSVKFNTSEGATIPTYNGYRSIGVIKDPLFANVEITFDSLTGAFTIGENVQQANSLATGIVTSFDGLNTLGLTNVYGTFLGGEVVTGADSSATCNAISYQINGQAKSFTTFDQRRRYSYTLLSATQFIANEPIYQTDIRLANAIFHGSTASNLYLTHLKGTINTGNNIVGVTSGASANVTTAYPPDIVVGSGEVIYLENLNPITRSNNQSETIKIILSF